MVAWRWQRTRTSPATGLSRVSVWGCVGFRIRISEIHAATKLSQGREIDHPRIIRELEERQGFMDQNIADAMKRLPEESPE